MWFIIGAVVYVSQFLVFGITSGQDDNWPDCLSAPNNSYGCKPHRSSLCVIRNETCRIVLCNLVTDQFSKCEDACNETPNSVQIDFKDFECFCSKGHHTVCHDDLIQTNNYAFSNTSHQSQLSSHARQKRSDNIWGGFITVPHSGLLPVFCNSQNENSCAGASFPSVCKSCDGWCYNNGFCYHMESKTFDTAPFLSDILCCDQRGAPVEIWTAEEKNFVLSLLLEEKNEDVVNKYIVTSGLVRAGTTELIWYGSDTLVNDTELFDGLNITEIDTDRILLMNLREWNIFESISWYLASPTNGSYLVLCKQDCSSLCADPEKSTTSTRSTTRAYPEEPTDCSAKCHKMDQYGAEWNCCGYSLCRQNCPLEAAGATFWQCLASTFETEWPSYSNCESSWVQNISQRIEAENVTSLELAVMMDQFLEESSMFGKDMSKAIQFTAVSLDLLIKEQEESNDSPVLKLHQRKFQTELAVSAFDKLLELEKPWQQINKDEKIHIGEEIQQVSEKFGFSVAKKAAEIGKSYSMSYKQKNMQLEAQYLKYSSGIGREIVRFPITEDPLQSSIVMKQLPNMLTRSNEIVNLGTVANHIPMKIAENMFPGSENSFQGDDKNKRLNSGMVSLTLINSNQRVEKLIQNFGLEAAVLIKFRHERIAKGPTFSQVERELYPGENPTAIQGTAKCAFWNSKIGINGAWDTSGCRLVNSSHWYSFCECNHLSSFALLMDVHKYVAKSKTLEVLGIVCSSLSVICLALTLFLLHVLKLKLTVRNLIGKHLCFCLMIGHLMALLVLDRSYFNMPQEICVGVGVILHYVFLAAFMWMAIEGHHLYRMVVQVFDTGRDFSRFYLAAGYGIPLLIVTITCTVTITLQDTGYANDNLCWLSAPTYVWAFMGPILCLIIANFVVLVIAMKIAISASNKQKKKKFAQKMKIWIRGWFSMAALLGVTWIFGFFYIQTDPTFAYIFVILNGCQGVFLFLTRIVFNKHIREALDEIWSRRKVLYDFYGFQWLQRSPSENTSQSPPWFTGNTASSQLNSATSPSTPMSPMPLDEGKGASISLRRKTEGII